MYIAYKFVEYFCCLFLRVTVQLLDDFIFINTLIKYGSGVYKLMKNLH